MRIRALVAVLTTCAATTLLLGPPADASRREDTCFGAVPTLRGAPGETVYGTDGPDVILGGGRVEAGAGDDLICDAAYVLAGDGNDRIRMTNGGTAYGEKGNDEFVAIADSLTTIGAILIGGPGRDLFYGSPVGETIYGNGGRDVARPGGGNDVVDLGAGNDRAYGGPGDDTLIGGPGNDYLDGGPGRDAADGGLGDDRCRAVEKAISCARVPRR